MVRECAAMTMTKVGLKRLRRAGTVLGLSIEDMQDIEAAIGYRSEDLGVLFDRWENVPKFRIAKRG